MNAQQRQVIKDKVIFAVLLSLLLFVTSLIFFWLFAHNISSNNAEAIGNSIIFQWAALISALLGIAFIGFAILLKMDPTWYDKSEEADNESPEIEERQ